MAYQIKMNNKKYDEDIENKRQKIRFDLKVQWKQPMHRSISSRKLN